MLHQLFRNAPIIRDQAVFLAIIIECHRAIFFDMHRLRQGLFALLRHFDLVAASFQLHRLLIELRQLQVLHGVVLERPETAAELGQAGSIQQLVTRAVGNGMRFIIVIERNLLRLGQSQLHIGTVKIAAQSIILCPAAAHGNLVIVSSGGQIHGQTVGIMPQRLHPGGHIARVPILLGAGLGLHGSGQHNHTPLCRFCLFRCGLIRLHALVADRSFMAQAVIGKGDFFLRRKFQADIAAITGTACTVILIPAAADGNLEFIITLGQFAFKLILAIAHRLHDCGTISRCPVCASPELALHRAHQHHIRSTYGCGFRHRKASHGGGKVCRHPHWCGQKPEGQGHADGLT